MFENNININDISQSNLLRPKAGKIYLKTYGQSKYSGYQ